MLFDFLKKYSEQFNNKTSSDISQDSQESMTPVSNGSDKIRCHIVFHGRVQGVGFRYTSYHLAESLGITGWVRNEYDGSVSCELQGSSIAIDTLLERINSQRWIDITDTDRTSMEVDPDERTFKILD